MPDKDTTGRLLAVIDPSATSLSAAAGALEGKGMRVVERLDILNTLVLEGGGADALDAAASTPGVRHVERERVVRTQN